MARTRLTWNKGDTKKNASPPAQTPNITRTEAPDHPAYKADPGPDDYLIGDGSPSQFAEDVHPGPYDTAAAPATPGYQEPADHPAAKPGKPMKAAQERRNTERRAAKCIRIASNMLGGAAEGVSEEQHTAAIENHALDLMYLPEENLQSMLQRLGMDEDTDDDEDIDKEASMSVTAAKDIMASIAGLKAGLTRIADHMGIDAGSLFAMDDDMMGMDMEMPMDDGMDMPMGMPMDEGMDEEDVLEEMLADAQGRDLNDPQYGYMGEGEAMDDDMGMEGMEEEEMLAAMLSGSHYAADEDDSDDEDADTEKEEKDDEEVEEAEEKEGSKKKAKGKIPPQFLENVKKKQEEAKDNDDDDDVVDDDDGKKASDDIILTADSDPMGLMDTSPTPDVSELAQLYMSADDNAASGTEVTAADDEDEDEDEVEASKKASRRPQPKKASKGVQSLGHVQKVASSEVGDLSSLWEHAPDVSSAFS